MSVVLWIIMLQTCVCVGPSILAFDSAFSLTRSFWMMSKTQKSRNAACCTFGPHHPAGEKAAPLPVSVTSALTSHRMKTPPGIWAFTLDKPPSPASLAGGDPVPQHGYTYMSSNIDHVQSIISARVLRVQDRPFMLTVTHYVKWIFCSCVSAGESFKQHLPDLECKISRLYNGYFTFKGGRMCMWTNAKQKRHLSVFYGVKSVKNHHLHCWSRLFCWIMQLVCFNKYCIFCRCFWDAGLCPDILD